MRNPCKGKSSWPELVGKAGKEAERIIEKENPWVNADIVEEGSVVGQDFRCDRVWVWVDPQTAIVTRTPVVG
ncbi:inhibitor of trypsin and hageman factor-like [Cucumis melo var. makuwa]|uniref:Inhibitor of trypsin and hageman factor-like n=1 Tax=Cucumis melo var. makuwa TaxID=1194695 RepID=A0A5D3D207_CUCMM|nr:inhibitor of trypsin and hageman factor-like [Cucumis melo var. makuwa]TYK17264.1 inhibitor of trypsin and hageman factor-like [Cucumis melo var. makuwa]